METTEQTPSEFTIIPKRTIRMEFTHPTIGDDLMVPKVEQAMRELIGAGVDRKTFLASNGITVSIKGLPMLDPPGGLTLNLTGIDPGAGDDASLVAEVGPQGVRIPERRAVWPDPYKMNFNPNRPDPYNANLRVDDKPKRRRTD